ncbi:flagellar hook-basal body protein [Bacillus methanolicus PB1]|uniref:Flagellar hook protein FlgE n=1 Tax=Bacillus methanolicus PB1 TaxID=997296 RepID=I3E4S3_BACMT|nr:flagellar hook-basal body complex protein [Bacillus methanolicus]EIJ81494.1 flagellar hook-basal body protein [Bacillus methanolicus PB1]
MLRSMYSGISGMKNFQTKLDVIGNNIANVNTFGYKKGRVTFKDTMNQTISGASAAQNNRGGKNPMQVGLGSTLATIDTIHTQSSLQTTGRPLDLAISGDGYFIVKQGDAQFYTRAGNFYLDEEGTLVNADGYKVQSYSNGTLQDIKVDVNAIVPAQITTKITIDGNFPSSVSGTTTQLQQIKVVDNIGDEHTVELKVESNGTNKWKLTLQDRSLTSTTPLVIDVDYGVNPFNATYNPASKNLEVSDGNGGKLNIPITVSFGNITTNGNNLNALFSPDGTIQGSLESFNIGQYGEINGVFSNGRVLQLGTLALAKFSNPSGLTKAGNNLFQESINSGTANINVPGDGRGTIAASSLEMSNVDLSEEFTEMITAQRGFQANTRIITTSDEILQELVNLKR